MTDPTLSVSELLRKRAKDHGGDKLLTEAADEIDWLRFAISERNDAIAIKNRLLEAAEAALAAARRDAERLAANLRGMAENIHAISPDRKARLLNEWADAAIGATHG